MTKDPTVPTDRLSYGYLVRIEGHSSGRKFGAGTGVENGGDYDLNRAVLDRIMASLVFTE